MDLPLAVQACLLIIAGDLFEDEEVCDVATLLFVLSTMPQRRQRRADPRTLRGDTRMATLRQPRLAAQRQPPRMPTTPAAPATSMLEGDHSASPDAAAPMPPKKSWRRGAVSFSARCCLRLRNLLLTLPWCVGVCERVRALQERACRHRLSVPQQRARGGFAHAVPWRRARTYRCHASRVTHQHHAHRMRALWRCSRTRCDA